MKNIFLSIKLELKRFFNIKPTKSYAHLLNDYELVMKLNSENTYTGHKWGAFHPQNQIQYWADEMVKYENRKFTLSTELKPKIISGTTIPFAIGVVTTKQQFLYGYFQSTIKLPRGNGLWPAFWLTADGWHSEIDILEAYSRENDYGNMRQRYNMHFKLRSNNFYVNASTRSVSVTEMQSAAIKNNKQLMRQLSRHNYTVQYSIF